MILTEDEAKTKWCPFVRAPLSVEWPNSPASPAINSLSDSFRCIASECMAWQWGNYHADGYDKAGNPLTAPTGEGYCGLAGKPAE